MHLEGKDCDVERNWHQKQSLEVPLPESGAAVVCSDTFLWSAPVAFRRVALETPEWTSRDSNHHRQSVSAGKTNAIQLRHRVACCLLRHKVKSQFYPQFARFCSWCLSLLCPLPSHPPSVCPLAPSGPVSALLVPPSGTLRLSYLCYGVLWLIGSCLHSSSWQQRLRPWVRLCPLHHVVGVFHFFVVGARCLSAGRT